MIYEHRAEERILCAMGYCFLCIENNTNILKFPDYEYLEEIETVWVVNFDEESERCFLYDDSLLGVYVNVRKPKRAVLDKLNIDSVCSLTERLTKSNIRYYEITFYTKEALVGVMVRLPDAMI